MQATTHIMGIVNVTPDSFSDGKHVTPDQFVAQAIQLVADGADCLDIGAESTRPGAVPVTPQQEWERLEPVLEPLMQQTDSPISIDTRHSDTVERVLKLGVHYINDVSGGADRRIWDVLRGSTARYIMMHNLGLPADPAEIIPLETDPVAVVISWCQRKLDALERAGIEPERVMMDPGIGFGKNAAQSLQLIRGCEAYNQLPIPYIIGHSRKSFLKQFGHSEDSPAERDAQTLALSAWLLQQPRRPAMLRVHNVSAHAKLQRALSAVHR